MTSVFIALALFFAIAGSSTPSQADVPVFRIEAHRLDEGQLEIRLIYNAEEIDHDQVRGYMEAFFEDEEPDAKRI